jgi:hypothetical protein
MMDTRRVYGPEKSFDIGDLLIFELWPKFASSKRLSEQLGFPARTEQESREILAS